MRRYKIGNLTVESNLALPELPAATGASDYQLHISACAAPRTGPVRWVQHWEMADGHRTLSVGRIRGGYLLHFPRMADFHLLDDEPSRVLGFTSNLSAETVRHLLLDQVIPLLLAKSGELVFHASAVLLPTGAVAFAGLTGQGKSTLTASLAQRGFPLLTDDCLLLEWRKDCWFVTPTYGGLRLWDDVRYGLFGADIAANDVAHYTSKKRVNGGIRFCDRTVSLQRLYLLAKDVGPAEKIAISIPAQHERLLRCLSHIFRLDPTDEDRLRGEFDALARLAASSLIREIRYPRRLELLPEVHRAILEDLNSENLAEALNSVSGMGKLA